ASTGIADGVMSGVPPRYSWLRLELTVERPFAPIAIAATPDATRTAAATTPPISKHFLSFISDTSFTATPCLRCFLECRRAKARRHRGKGTEFLRVFRGAVRWDA